MTRLALLLLRVCCVAGQADARSRFAPQSGRAHASRCRSAACGAAHPQGLMQHTPAIPHG